MENNQYQHIPQEKFAFAQLDADIKDKKLETKARGYMADALLRFKKNKSSVVAAYIIMLLVVFAIVTIFSIAGVRPLLKRLFHTDSEKVATNASALIGRRGKVCVVIDEDGGRVMIDGVDWKAVSLDGQSIAEGAQVEVVAIDSVILTVKPL